MHIQLVNHERRAVKLSRNDERWFTAFDALIAAQEDLLQVQLNSPEDTNALKDAGQRVIDAKSEFGAADRIGVNAASYSYRTEQVRLQNQLAALETEMVVLKAV